LPWICEGIANPNSLGDMEFEGLPLHGAARGEGGDTVNLTPPQQRV
jgi:hypothetical protein